MNLVEEAILYAVIMHQGKVRKFRKTPYILHPMEVAQILSTLTEDQEVIAAGVLHDIVEDTDGTAEEIERRFGKRVAFLVASETENAYPELDRSASWKRRKEESLLMLKNSTDPGVQMLWLADKLANIRSLARMYSEMGEDVWKQMHQSDPAMQCWYYRSVAELLELSLNKTGAFKELIQHINFLWPGTFDSNKTKYRKYKDVSVAGCRLIGHGAKGDVYRYDDELVIKVYNRNNTYADVEREIALSRRAFILGIPTAISFGIVSVGEHYGAMFELLNSDTISTCIARNTAMTDSYAKIMADLAHVIHQISGTVEDGFPDILEKLDERISGGIGYEDEKLAEKCRALIHTLGESRTLIHGDLHTGNVFLNDGEPLLIDMDRISLGHPIVEISDMYLNYVLRQEDDPKSVEEFMGFSGDIARQFFASFLKHYLQTEDEERLIQVKEKAELLVRIRMIRRLRKQGTLSRKELARFRALLKRTDELTEKVHTLTF